MRKILCIVMLVWAALTACKKEEPEPFRLDPNAMIRLRGDANAAKDQIAGLTPLEVVQNAVNIKWQSNYFSNEYREEPFEIGRSFIDDHKDFETPALLMWGTDIISQQGEFYKDFIYGFSVCITDSHNDTIACVPNEVIDNARVLIEAAYYAEDYEEVYRLFNEAFTFLPMD